MLITLSNKYFRLTTENYAVYIPVKEYDQIFPEPIFRKAIKSNSSLLLHTLSKEEESEMRNEIVKCQSSDGRLDPNFGVLYEHIFEYMEFDKETIKMTKRLEYDNPLNEDIPNAGEKLTMSSICYATTRSHKNNNWKRRVKINKLKIYQSFID